MNLVQELNRIAARNAQAEIDESQKLIDSISIHLEDESKKDQEMLKYFGVSSVAQEHQERVSFNEKRLVGAVLKIEDIQSICLKYALRFLPAKQYIKGIPTKALNDLRNFQQSNNIENLEPAYYEDKGLFIIAPVSHFKLGPRPKKDPVLVWRDKDSYKVVSQWGSDFTWTRRLFGWFKNKMMEDVFFGYGLLAAFSVGYAIYLSIYKSADYLFIILAAVFCALPLFITASIIDGSSNWNKKTK